MHNLQEIHKFQRAIPQTGGGGEMGEGVGVCTNSHVGTARCKKELQRRSSAI